jgi:SAM-dependent methyltransferase
MGTKHLDLGCGSSPRNPYHCDELYAVDIKQTQNVDDQRFKSANLSLESIPHADSSFDSVSSFDFLEHVPRILPTVDGRATRFPFLELMDEIHRVLKPHGRFYALTPAYPSPEAFQDPTHVNIITEETWRYFCGDAPMARPYGFKGQFKLLRNERALHPYGFEALTPLTKEQSKLRERLLKMNQLPHLMWEFSCIKIHSSAP